MVDSIQRSFAGGEIGPQLVGRADTTKHATALATCRNMLVQRFGSAGNRAGLQFVAATRNSLSEARLIPFEPASDLAYVLEFGFQYMRVHFEGALITFAQIGITAVTQAANAQITTSGAHGLAVGNRVLITGVGGMIQLQNIEAEVVTVVDPTNYTISVDSTSFDAYTSGGNMAQIYEISTPYNSTQVKEMVVTSSVDVMTITHPDQPVYDLKHFAATNFTLTAKSFEPSISRPQNFIASPGAAGTDIYSYQVVAVSAVNGELSRIGLDVFSNITGATNANPVVVTSVGHGRDNGDTIFIQNVMGMTELNGNEYVIGNVAANTMELVGVDGTGFGTYTSGGNLARLGDTITSAAPTTAIPNIISWAGVTDVLEYNVYKRENGIYGFIGVTSNTTFLDTNIAPDTSDTPPIFKNPFSGAGNYPSTCAYYQQRLWLAATDNNPETVWASRSGQFNNFSISSPLQDDDAIEFVLAGGKLNRVLHLVSLDNLLILTQSSEWIIRGDQDGVVRPTAINPRKQGGRGASTPLPAIVGPRAVFVQATGAAVRELEYQVTGDAYDGRDLTIYSPHLFEGLSIIAVDYQQVPDSTIWCVRSDGVLLGMTYLPEQDIWGWHRHDSPNAKFESIAVVREGTDDRLYAVVLRDFGGGVTRRYVERFSLRTLDDERRDPKFLDSWQVYDGDNLALSGKAPLAEVTITTVSGGWGDADTVQITCTEPLFLLAEAGTETVEYQVRGTDADGNPVVAQIRYLIYVSDTVAQGRPLRVVPEALRGVASNDWSRAVFSVSGITNLSGQNAGVYADGYVKKDEAVVDGQIIMDQAHGYVAVGLKYLSVMQTLPFDAPDAGTLEARKKRLHMVTLRVLNTRNVEVGADEDELSEVKIPAVIDYTQPNAYQTGLVDTRVESRYRDEMQVVVLQREPLPMEILSVIPTWNAGG